ncbi:MAG: hypothetical protein E7299_00260 [Lachnospiraceae bacterium]|nr:hypothetical protein [Lachnospiraceae bacterium]
MQRTQKVVLSTAKIISYGLFAIIISYLFMVSIFNTCVMCYIDEHIFYVKDFGILMVFGIAVFLLLCAFAELRWEKAKRNISDSTTPVSKPYGNTAYHVGTLLWFVVLLLLIFTISLRPQYDPGSVYDAAGSLLRGDFSEWQQGGYLYTFPFQNGLVLLEVPFWVLLGEKAYLGIQVYNLILWYVAILGLCYLAKEFFGEHVSKITYVILLMFIPMWSYVTYVYGTVPGLSFSVLAMCFEHRYEKTGRWKHLLFCAICLFIAVMYKSNYEIFAIAVGIMLLLHGIKNKTWKSIVGLILVVVAVVLEIKLIPYVMHILTGADTGNGIPMIAWVAMGLKESNIAPGWYNRFTVLAYEECQYNIAAVQQRSVASIQETLKLFADNKDYAISFFGRKIASMWSSPDLEGFSTIGKMNVNGTLPYWMKDIFYGGGIMNTVLLLVLDVFQSMVYALVLVHLLLKRKKITLEQIVLLTTFLGGFLFHLFWEGKCQYSIPYYVLLLPYAASGFVEVVMHIKELLNMPKNARFAQVYKSVTARVLGIGIAVVLICTVWNGNAIQSMIRMQSDTGEWIYFIQNSTYWKSNDFRFGELYYKQEE